MTAKYNEIIQEQLQQEVIEPAPATEPEKAFYIPHKAVVRKQAETTKLRVVYDASAKETEAQPSLNDCLHPGPPLQNLLWDVLVKSRFLPVLLTGDLKQAFLRVRIKAQDRDSLRFHWKEPNSDAILVYRFTRALFGLTCSPFLLGGVLKHHLDAWEQRYPEIVQRIREGLYVDDLITGVLQSQKPRSRKRKLSKFSMMLFSPSTNGILTHLNSSQRMNHSQNQLTSRTPRVTWERTNSPTGSSLVCPGIGFKIP